MATVKIKTANGYEKVEIPSCLPANVEFGEPEDWTSRWNTSFVADCDGICTFTGNFNGNIGFSENSIKRFVTLGSGWIGFTQSIR